jgi:galactokinase
MLDAARVGEEFAGRFGRACAVVARAPGRVNLIGEHTDYNEGFVLPMALEQCTWAAAARRDDGRLAVVAADFGDERSWGIGAWSSREHPAWTSYVAGVAELMRRRVPAGGGAAPPLQKAALLGADVLIRSDVPVGAGLSSSAALEAATALALGRLAGSRLSGTELADLCREAEHEFAGVPCGIMDQYVSVLGQEGCALLLDCRSRTWEHVPLKLGDYVVLVVDSGVKHSLAASGYAERRAECQRAVETLRVLGLGCRSLRDVRSEDVRARLKEMDAVLGRRALHVTTENERTTAAAEALRRGDLTEFGRLMDASHRSLRDDYEASCREVDALVETVRSRTGVLGARMTGGGFGGSGVALVRREAVAAVEQAVREKYDGAGFGKSRVMVTQAGGGATVEMA